MQIENRDYNLDPKETQGKDFPGGTFRVRKQQEIEQFGSIGRGVSFYRRGMG